MSMSGRRYSTCALVGLALPLLTLSVFIGHGGPDAGEIQDQAADGEAQRDPLRGLWTQWESQSEGEPVSFWYFHGDGKGLYRYGLIGLTNTHSFDYVVRGSGEDFDLDLRFRKSGDAHDLRAHIRSDSESTWLTFDGDPRVPGASYRLIDSSLDLADRMSRRADTQSREAAKPGIGDRLWIDYRNHATGGSEFHMYQLAKTALDGRGVGWFHRGDFDNWSTESLTYRIDGDEIELYFDLYEDDNTTKFRIVESNELRELILDEDPRDFWATHRYKDGGRSFEGAPAFAAILALEGYLAGDENRPQD